MTSVTLLEEPQGRSRVLAPPLLGLCRGGGRRQFQKGGQFLAELHETGTDGEPLNRTTGCGDLLYVILEFWYGSGEMATPFGRTVVEFGTKQPKVPPPIVVES